MALELFEASLFFFIKAIKLAIESDLMRHDGVSCFSRKLYTTLVALALEPERLSVVVALNVFLDWNEVFKNKIPFKDHVGR